MSWSVFAWTSALEDFLNPYHHLTPLVELPVDLNPYAQDGVRVFLKLQTFLPLGNIKSLSARGMLHQAKESWQFDDQLPHTIVENSSGNTAFSLAVLGRSMGIPKMRAWVSQEITKGKLQLLQLFGVEAVVHAEQICPNPQDPRSGIVKAREEGKQAWRYNPDQYHNIANPQIHARLTGKQLSEQLQSLKDEVEFRFFCAGLGTTGTFIGISECLKSHFASVSALGVVRKPNNPIPWPRTYHLLQQIGFDWQAAVDVLVEVSSKQAYESSLALIRAGFLVGPSSGMALQGLFLHLAELKALGQLSPFSKKPMAAVVICPDGPYPYLDEYFTYCDAELFPEVLNQELLLESSSLGLDSFANTLRESKKVFEKLYVQALESEDSFSDPEDLVLRQEYVLIDLRTQQEFAHVHLPGALCLPFAELSLESFRPFADKTLVLYCAYGKKSAFWAQKLQELGYHAFSLQGGLAEWSSNTLPRCKAKDCLL